MVAVARFKVAFNRLAVATRLPADQADSASQRVYFDALSDLPIESLEAAAVKLAKSAQWFPKVSEWREAAKAFKRDELSKALPAPQFKRLSGVVEDAPSVPVAELQSAMDDYLAMRAAGVTREDAVKGLEGLLRVLLPMRRAEEWHYECVVCEDSGFEFRTCYPDTSYHCGMRSCRKRREHTYTVFCACRPTNRTWLRRQAVLHGTVGA